MSEHTPGPWHYCERVTYRTVDPGVEEPEDSWIEIRDEGYLIVAKLPGGSIYDAALIAAAPETAAELKRVRAVNAQLLKALQHAREAVKSLPFDALGVEPYDSETGTGGWSYRDYLVEGIIDKAIMATREES